MTITGTIFVAGGSRGVGREVIHLLRQQGLAITALLRSPATQAELEALDVSTILGDALSPEAMKQAMATGPIDAVISTIGGMPQDGMRSDYVGNKNLIDAAVAVGVRKFVLVTSIGSGDSAAALPPPVLQTLGPVLQEKKQAEDYLIASGLTYTIIRPGGLKSEPATGNGILTLNPLIAGTIHRADVAQLVVACLLSEAANNRVFSAIDRTMAYGQPGIEAFQL